MDIKTIKEFKAAFELWKLFTQKSRGQKLNKNKR
jgi:hypothetical protein